MGDMECRSRGDRSVPCRASSRAVCVVHGGPDSPGRHEWQADQFACELSGAPDALAAALIKLSRENLANLHPHPLYAKFFYSHPPVVERVQWLLEKVKKD
jgi:hypothetical protein